MALLSARKLRWFGGLLALGVLMGMATIGWQRERLLTWYYLRGLAHADEREAYVWVERVASRGETAVPGILDCMTREDAKACANARAALHQIMDNLPTEDPRWKETG